MKKEPLTLSYAPPPRALTQILTDSLVRAMGYIAWFMCRRPLHAGEVFIGGWLFLAVGWTSLALISQIYRGGFGWFTITASLIGATIVVVVFSFARLLAQRRWLALLLCVVIAIPAGFLSGVLQSESCPHATYLQVFGLSVPVAGRACSNTRDATPWWVREE